MIEGNPGISTTHFTFYNRSRNQPAVRLAANSSAYFGTYINYKWLSVKYYFPLPETRLLEDKSLHYTSFKLRFPGKKFGIDPFYDNFNGLLLPQRPHWHDFTGIKGLHFKDAGADLYYFPNHHKFSFQATNYYSKKQVKSAGSLFLMATPLWQQIFWNHPTNTQIKDSSTYHFLQKKTEWVSLLARIGYSYSFVLNNGNWMITPSILAGEGVVKPVTKKPSSWKDVSDWQAWLNIGYNGSGWYLYFAGFIDNLHTNLSAKKLQQLNTDLSFTYGYRFMTSPHKLGGIL